MINLYGFCGCDCGWGPNDHFVCPRCERRVCYCQGCSLDDGLDDLCDECWCEVVKETESSFDSWMTKLERAIRICSRLRRRILNLSDSGRVELWGRMRKLMKECASA